jgi:hypothetical protein
MNTVLAMIAVVGGVIVSLVGFEVVKLDKFISPAEAQNWHEKFGKIAKIVGPVAAIIGLLLLLWR